MPIENYGIASRQSKCLCKLMGLWRHYRRRNNFFVKEKYNMFKKILLTMLCIAITANLITANVFAMENTWENTPENEEIIKALQLIEPIKENYGLTDDDLENMKVGEPSKTYEYTMMIYNANCCYLSNGADFQKLGSYEETGGRSILTKFALETSTLDLSDISKTHNLNYTNITTRRY